MATTTTSGMHRIDPSAGLAVLRIIIGIIFVFHGADKLFGGIADTAGFFGMSGIPAPALMAWVAALTEFLGGIALIVGFGSRIAAALLIGVMLVAILTVHLPNGFANVNIVGMGESGPVFGMPGWEYNLALIGALAATLLGGPGRWAMGHSEPVVVHDRGAGQ